MALWSLLGERGVDIFAWESFGSGWAADCQKQLKLKDLRSFKADYGKIPDLSQAEWDRDVVFTWNGTTSGVCVPNGDWIAADRAVCDALALEQARCRDLVVAEGDGRRIGARHDRTLAARRETARVLYARLAAAQDFPNDKRRQAHGRHFRG
jgi:hypothetical protein